MEIELNSKNFYNPRPKGFIVYDIYGEKIGRCRVAIVKVVNMRNQYEFLYEGSERQCMDYLRTAIHQKKLR